MYHSEILSGMTQVDFMNKLAATEDLSPVVEKLKTIASIVLAQPSLRVAITCGEDAVPANETALAKLVSGFPAEKGIPPTQPVSGKIAFYVYMRWCVYLNVVCEGYVCSTIQKDVFPLAFLGQLFGKGPERCPLHASRWRQTPNPIFPVNEPLSAP